MTIQPPSVMAQADAPINAPGYAVAPNAVLRDPRLSPTARLLYVVLDGRRAARGKGIRVSVATLAADVGCADATIRRAADELQNAGWLARRRTGRTSLWVLDNPIRAGRRINPGGGPGGPESRGPEARTLTDDGSDRSLVSALQSITREDYNNTADLVPAPAFGGALGDQSQQGTGHETSDQHPSSRTRASTGQHAAATSRDKKTAQTRAAAAPGDITAAYLAEINAATGAKLVPTRPLRDLLGKIAARGIPAPEAALTAAAWLAVKGESIASPEGFLAAIALPSMANGQELDTSPPKPTPTPPTYRELVTRELCAHGAELGRCALCRRPAAAPPPEPAEDPRLTAMLAKLGDPR